jgi:hypothetical protein
VGGRAAQRRSGRTDSDSGEAFDHVNRTGRARAEAHAARCSGLRQRIARYDNMRPRAAELNGRLSVLRPYLARWRCG